MADDLAPQAQEAPAMSWASVISGRGWAGFGFRLLSTAICLGVMYSFLDFHRIAAVIRRADPQMVAAALALIAFCTPIQSLRWKVILRELGTQVSLVVLIQTSLKALFFGIALPSANGSDLMRAALLRGGGTPLKTGLTSVVIDRFYGVCSLGIMALTGTGILLVRGERDPMLGVMGLACMVLLVAAACGLALLFAARYGAPIKQEGVGSRLLGAIGRFSRFPAAAFQRPRTMMICLMLSLLGQVFNIIAISRLGRAVNLDQPLWVYFAVVPAVWIAVAIPVGFFGIGVREASFAFFFQKFGATYEHGIALGVLTSALNLFIAALGGFSLAYTALAYKKDTYGNAKKP